MNFYPSLIENRYRYLLITQVIFALSYPVIENWPDIKFLLELILISSFVAGVIVAGKNRAQFIVSVVLALGFLTTHWWVIFTSDSTFNLASLIFGAVFFANIAILLIMDIFGRHESITSDLLYGVISVYWLIGVSFAFIFAATEVLSPGSFEGHELSVADVEVGLSSFVYYSFVTLTTLGYGDITPLTREAGIFAYTEAMIGQLYLAILVARLIGMHLTGSHTK